MLPSLVPLQTNFIRPAFGILSNQSLDHTAITCAERNDSRLWLTVPQTAAQLQTTGESVAKRANVHGNQQDSRRIQHCAHKANAVNRSEFGVSEQDVVLS